MRLKTRAQVRNLAAGWLIQHGRTDEAFDLWRTDFAEARATGRRELLEVLDAHRSSIRMLDGLQPAGQVKGRWPELQAAVREVNVWIAAG